MVAISSAVLVYEAVPDTMTKAVSWPFLWESRRLVCRWSLNKASGKLSQVWGGEIQSSPVFFEG